MLDSNIISEPMKPICNQLVCNKVIDNQHNSYVSAITIYELYNGILRMPNGQRKNKYYHFFDNIICKNYQVLSYTEKEARIHSVFVAKLLSIGRPVPFQDSMIAATALANNLTLVTRNTKDFKNIAEVTGLRLENWFEDKR